MEILETRKITNEEWLNLFVRSYRHCGKEGRWTFASRHDQPPVPSRGVDAVMVVPMLRDPGKPTRLVMTKEFRIPIGDLEYAFPAGLVEPGEDVLEAARREVREETGLEVTAFTKVSPPTYSSAGLADECVVIAFADARTPEDCRQALDDLEHIEVVLLDHAGVCRLCESDVRINGRTWPILYLYQQLGRLD